MSIPYREEEGSYCQFLDCLDSGHRGEIVGRQQVDMKNEFVDLEVS